MATTKYEILYIIRPNIDEDAKQRLLSVLTQS
jgi:ribosomal protein S6